MRVVVVEPSAVERKRQPAEGRRGGGGADGAPDPVSTVVVIGHGEVRSFEAVFRADHRAVVAIAWALTGNRGVAEEVTQEAFLRAHQRWSRIGR